MLTAGIEVQSFKLVRPLGLPGQDGEVWEAHKTLHTGVVVKRAIKFLHNLDAEARARFNEEISNLVDAHSKCPHLVTVDDCGFYPGEDNQIPFYIMKLLTNPTRFDAYLTSKGMDPSIVISMLTQAIKGLSCLHDVLNRNHTDIKGSNLLISWEPGPELYITDFGFIRERGTPIDRSRHWKRTSQQPPPWVRDDDIDIWQLGETLRPLLKEVTATKTGAITWLRHLIDEMAPTKKDVQILSAKEICEQLERRQTNLRSAGVWCWQPLQTRAIASLVTAAYEYHESPLTAELLITLLLRERKPPILASNDDEILLALDSDLPANLGPRSSPGTGLSVDHAKEMAKRILFGLPLDASRMNEAAEEWKYLEALIGEIPARSPLDSDSAVYRKYTQAVIRQKHVQLSRWDAGVRFLTSGQGTRVYFCSGYDAFAVSKEQRGETDLRATALESLKRGAQFVFVVPTADTSAVDSANAFVQYVKDEEPELSGQIEIKRVPGSQNSASTPKGAKRRVPKWEAGGYFTPGFRYVLFKEEDAASAVHDKGAFMVGLPYGPSDELFALRYSMGNHMTKDFLSWLRFVGALTSP